MTVEVVFDFTIDRHQSNTLARNTDACVIDSRVKGFGRLNPSRRNTSFKSGFVPCTYRRPF